MLTITEGAAALRWRRFSFISKANSHVEDVGARSVTCAMLGTKGRYRKTIHDWNHK